jgi:hypothetical protein
MSKNQHERRYSDHEFALVLRKVSELQRDRPGAMAKGEGLTLEEMQQIAAEAGLDPQLVAQAVALLPAHGPSLAARIFGGPSKFRMVRSVPGHVEEEELGRFVETIRDVLEQQGEARQLLGALEWSTTTNPTRVSVNVSPREDETRLEVVADRGGTAFLSYFGSLFVGLIAASAVGGGLGLESVAGVAGAFLSGIGITLATGRTIFKAGSRKWSETVPRLLDALAGTARELAEHRRAPPESDAPAARREP